jgi:hypothetical protein
MKGLPACLIERRAMNAELYRTDSLEIKREHIVQKWHKTIVSPYILLTDIFILMYHRTYFMANSTETVLLSFEVFTAVTMKNAVFWDIKPQFVRNRRNITSPLQRPDD